MSTSMNERMKKLRELHSKRQEARQLNHSQVVEEDRRNKEPKNMEQRRKRAQYLLDEEKMRSECEAQGKDFEREKMKMIPAGIFFSPHLILNVQEKFKKNLFFYIRRG